MVVTKENKVVSGIMLEKPEIRQRADGKPWLYKANFDEAKVKDGYIELRLDWESVYSAELERPADLQGRLVKRYRLANGIPHFLDEKKDAERGDVDYLDGLQEDPE